MIQYYTSGSWTDNLSRQLLSIGAFTTQKTCAVIDYVHFRSTLRDALRQLYTTFQFIALSWQRIAPTVCILLNGNVLRGLSHIAIKNNLKHLHITLLCLAKLCTIKLATTSNKSNNIEDVKNLQVLPFSLVSSQVIYVTDAVKSSKVGEVYKNLNARANAAFVHDIPLNMPSFKRRMWAHISSELCKQMLGIMTKHVRR